MKTKASLLILKAFRAEDPGSNPGRSTSFSRKLVKEFKLLS
jgi:hypothetical protein